MYVTDVTDIYMSKNGRYLIDAVFDGESHGGLRFGSFCCLHAATKHIIYMPGFLAIGTLYDNCKSETRNSFIAFNPQSTKK